MVSKEYFGEGKNIEFKRELPKNHEKFLKDVIAFSNSTGGQVVLGIEDETCVVYGIGEQSPFKILAVNIMKSWHLTCAKRCNRLLLLHVEQKKKKWQLGI